jgi:hypothetical protein
MSLWVTVVFSAVRREQKTIKSWWSRLSGRHGSFSPSSQTRIRTIDTHKSDRMCWSTNTIRVLS